jgi:hypothetical protein
MISNSLPHIICCSPLDITKFDVPKLEGNSRVGQMTSWLLYDGANILLRTDPITIVKYGIPCLGTAWCRIDSDRNFIKIPYDPDQESCVSLFKVLGEIDDYMVNSCKQLFGSQSNKYAYVPIVKEIEHEDDEVNMRRKLYNRLSYCKVKFNTNPVTGELTTRVFRRDHVGEPYFSRETKTVTDLTYYLKFKSTAKFVIAVDKVWVDKFACGKSRPKNYGVTLRCYQIDIIDCQQNYLDSAIKYLRENYIFEPVGVDVHADVDADAGTDAGTDVDADADADAGTDVAADAGTDVDADAGTDVAADAGTDVDADAGADAGTDVDADTDADVAADAGTDVDADAGTDVDADASGDLGADAGINVDKL